MDAPSHADLGQAGTCVQDGRECEFVRRRAATVEEATVEGNRGFWKGMTGVAADQNVPKEDVRLGNFVKQVAGVGNGIADAVKIYELGDQINAAEGKPGDDQASVELLSGVDGFPDDAGFEYGNVLVGENGALVVHSLQHFTCYITNIVPYRKGFVISSKIKFRSNYNICL